MPTPLVSVCVLTYNHEKFISQCFDSILMQKGNFDIEILVHDDASKDGTVDIIKKYRDDYPDVIKPIFQQENQYVKKEGGINVRFNIPRSKGKYIAICDGDDYWTDPNKLKTQVDFLEKNPDFALSYHHTYVQYGEKIIESTPPTSKTVFTIKDLILNLPAPRRALSNVFRRNCFEDNFPPDWLLDQEKIIETDWAINIIAALKGKIHYSKKPMGVYRVHKSSIWSSKDVLLINEKETNYRKHLASSVFSENKEVSDLLMLSTKVLSFEKVEKLQKMGKHKEAKEIYNELKASEILRILQPRPFYRVLKCKFRFLFSV